MSLQQTAVLAHSARGCRKAPEFSKVMGRALLWNFNPQTVDGRSWRSSLSSWGGTVCGGDRECRGVREGVDQLEMEPPLLLA